MKTKYYDAEMQRIVCEAKISWEEFGGKSVLISGATGLIGAALVNTLLCAREKKGINVTIYAMVRSKAKALGLFGEKADGLEIIEHKDIIEPVFIAEQIDYIIHAANPTESAFFVNQPVETIRTSILGTMNMLALAYEKKVKGMVYLSSMEVYGYPKKGEKVSEDCLGAFSTVKVRNCYPLSKKMCENLCYSYYAEYSVPTKIVRLTQTFGVGVDYKDKRIFAEIARCVIEKKNIVLKTKGLTERAYLDLSDAVTAILLVLIQGGDGEIYTAANEDTYCSVREMAKLVADKYGIEVVVEEQDNPSAGYADELYMDLDTTKLRNLGWRPQGRLIDIYDKMICDLRSR